MARHLDETAGLISRIGEAKDGAFRSFSEGGPIRMFYVYCIESQSLPVRCHIGFSGDLKQRVADHNDGCNPSTAPDRPWRLKGYVAFDNKPAALDFERYLKTGSGHAFRKRRLW